jgi:4-alpha-glucanotransferase
LQLATKRPSVLLQDKKYLKAYLGSDGKDVAWDFIRAAMASVSNTSIIMMQVCVQAGLCV